MLLEGKCTAWDSSTGVCDGALAAAVNGTSSSVARWVYSNEKKVCDGELEWHRP